MAFIWVLIPLAAILVGAFSEYLKFREKQARLGDSTVDLERNFDQLKTDLEEENKALVRRIQNLEAIVTSQTWDEMHALPALPEREKPVIELEPDEPSDAERAELLARKIRH